MKRKTYMDPTTKVVKLQHRNHLLVGSGGTSATQESYESGSSDGQGNSIWHWGD